MELVQFQVASIEFGGKFNAPLFQIIVGVTAIIVVSFVRLFGQGSKFNVLRVSNSIIIILQYIHVEGWGVFVVDRSC